MNFYHFQKSYPLVIFLDYNSYKYIKNVYSLIKETQFYIKKIMLKIAIEEKVTE